MPIIQPRTVVDGEARSAKDLLAADFEIPAYQREYVWQEKHVGQLCDDLVDHYGRFAKKEELIDPHGYFLGAMVVIENDGGARLEVVDGQQRLTTLSAIATVLLDRLDIIPLSDPQRAGYEHLLQGMLGKFDSGRWEPKLCFHDTDLGLFFVKSCLHHRSRLSKEAYWSEPWCEERIKKRRTPIARLKSAIDIGYERLDAFLAKQADPELKQKRFLSFLSLFSEAIVVLKITARSYSSAYAIFESLNNRSVPLSQADLVKNELLKQAPAADRDDITDNWVHVRQRVEASEPVQLPDLLHYSVLSRYGRVRARDLYQRVKEAAGNGVGPKQFSMDLVEDADALDALTENFKSAWKTQTTDMLKDIKNVLNVKLCYPFLLAAFRKHQDSAVNFDEHVRAVMNFAFRYVKVLEGSLESFANAISDAALLVNNDQPIAKIRELFLSHAPDTEFVEEFKEYLTPATKLAYFTVYYLEKVQITGAVPTHHGLDQNLEHIMPRSPGRRAWPEIHNLKQIGPEVFRKYLWRIGNLLPLPATINKSIKNREIAHKVSPGANYNDPSLGLASPKGVEQYLEGGSWTYQSIEARQHDLATKYAARAWSLS